MLKRSSFSTEGHMGIHDSFGYKKSGVVYQTLLLYIKRPINLMLP
jgi:hypothetical protein